MHHDRRARWRGTAIAAIAVLVGQLIFAFVAQPFGPGTTSGLWFLGFTAVFGGGLAFYDSMVAVRRSKSPGKEE